MRIPGFTPKVRLCLGIPRRIVRQQKAYERYERRKVSGKKTAKISPAPVPEKFKCGVVRFEQDQEKIDDLTNNDDMSDGRIWYVAKSRPKGFRGT